MKIKNYLAKLTGKMLSGSVTETPCRNEEPETIMPRRRLRVFHTETMRFYYPFPNSNTREKS